MRTVPENPDHERAALNVLARATNTNAHSRPAECLPGLAWGPGGPVGVTGSPDGTSAANATGDEEPPPTGGTMDAAGPKM